jgi:hypothetical protein
MTDFLEFVKAWAKLIASVVSEYPLAAAIVTLVGVMVFLQLQQKWGTDWPARTFNFFVVLIGWSIVTPVLGFILKALGFAGSGMAFVYERYSKQPIAALAIVLMASLAYFVWRWRRPGRPSRFTKGLVCTAIGLVTLAVAAPVLEVFNPSSQPTQVKALPTQPASAVKVKQ